MSSPAKLFTSHGSEHAGIGVPADNFNESQVRELLINCVFDPGRWCRNFLPVWEPDTWQIEAHKALVDHRYIALSTGTGPGKTFWTAATIYWFLTTRMPEAQVLCTAPILDQLTKTGLWPAMARIKRSSKLLQNLFETTQEKVFLRGYKNECFAIARTARIQPGKVSPEGLQGIHAPHILVFVDEASGIADQVLAAVTGAMTHQNAMMILASNPNRRSGQFYRIITDERKQVEGGGKFKVLRVSCENSKYADRELAETIAATFGRSSDEYRIKVLGLPPLSDAQSLISPEQVYAAHERIIEPAGPITVSCDPGRYGNDPAVFYVRQGWTFLRRVIINSMSTTDLAKVGWDLVDEYHADYFNIEVNGLGAGTVDRAKEIYRERRGANDGRYYDVKICEIDMSGQAKNKKKFVNRRSELYWQMRETIELISLHAIEHSDLLDEELSSIPYGWSQDDARIKIPAKDQIKAELGRSPNDADSVIINLYSEIDAGVEVTAATFEIGQKSTSLHGLDASEHNSSFDIGASGRRAGIFSFGSGPTGRRRLNPLNNSDFGVGSSRFRGL